VQQVSENCSRAAEASRGAAETARGDDAVVEKALTQMHSISESVSGTAKKIGELGRSTDQIGRIAGLTIADQTNLLALSMPRSRPHAQENRGVALQSLRTKFGSWPRHHHRTKEIAPMIPIVKAPTDSRFRGVYELEGALS